MHFNPNHWLLRHAVAWIACVALALVSGHAEAAPPEPETITHAGRSYRVLGDILVPLDQVQSTTGAAPGTRWTGGTLYYAFTASVDTAKRKNFRSWAADWETDTGVRFVESASAANRVEIKIDGNRGCGSSPVGMLGGVQVLVIATDDPANNKYCWERGIVLHELGHALGLLHEQQRSDRDTYVSVTDGNVVKDCGQEVWDANFKPSADMGTFTAYDFASIMHYPSSSSYTCDGKKASATISARVRQPNGWPAGSENACTTAASCTGLMGRRVLSPRDRYALAKRYGQRIDIIVGGNGSGSYSAVGQRDSCGAGCYLVEADLPFRIWAAPAADSVAVFSGLCAGRECLFPAATSGSVTLRFIKKRSLAAVARLATVLGDDDTIFENGFD